MLISFYLEFIWLLLIFLLPISFSPFVVSIWQIKYTLLISLTQILALLWLLKILFAGAEQSPNQKKIKILVPFLIFISLLTLTLLFSERPEISFWGTYQRKMGYLTWLHCFIFFLVLFFNLKSKKQIKRIVWTIFFSSLVVVFYGILQILGLDPIIWIENPLLTKRVFSFTGQPNFLASFLLLTLPLIFWLFLEEKKSTLLNPPKEERQSRYLTGFTLLNPQKEERQSRYLTGFIVKSLIFIGFVFSLICLFLTGSRGGLVGLLAGLFFFLIFKAIISQKKKLLFFTLLVLFVSLSLVVFLNFTDPLKDKKIENPFLSRFSSLLHLRRPGETAQYRLVLWQNAWSLIKRKPVFGYGLETQFFQFIKLFKPQEAVLEEPQLYADRAHNDFLDMAVQTGLLGFFGYLLMIGYVFFVGFKKRSLYLLTALFSYLVSLQFSFHDHIGLLYFWLYFALIVLPNHFKN